MKELPNIRKESDEVYYFVGPITCVEAQQIDWLISQAAQTERKRARICFHEDIESPVHEMLIAMGQESYVPPHRHDSKSESYQLLRGRVDLLVFSEEGELEQVLEMNADDAGPVYARIPSGIFHTFLFRSPWTVYFETSQGPFRRSATTFAPWGSSEDSGKEFLRFREQLEENVRTFKERAAAS